MVWGFPISRNPVAMSSAPVGYTQQHHKACQGTKGICSSGTPKLLGMGVAVVGPVAPKELPHCWHGSFQCLTPNGFPISCRSKISKQGSRTQTAMSPFQRISCKTNQRSLKQAWLCIKYFGLATLPWHYRYSCVACFATVASLQNKELALVIF